MSALETATAAGPRTSDAVFFLEALDLEQPQLAQVKEAAQAGDFPAARHAFGDMLRAFLRPEAFFKAAPVPQATPELLQKAEDACNHHMVSCGVAADFGDQPVDWYANPTYNKYCEWPWQLSRHDEILTLARAYRATGEERYAAAAAELVESWIRQAACPDPCSGYLTLSWRTIECGIRMGLAWPEILHSLYRSRAFTDDVLVDWCKSVYEHGVRLRRDLTSGNWLIMEMNGLVQIGALYPFLKDAESWFTFARDRLLEELKKQVYDDGFQYEITTRYQEVVIRNYIVPLRVLRAYGKKLDPLFCEKLDELLRVYIRLMRPDGRVPDFNDGLPHKVADLLEEFPDVLADDPAARWIRTGKKEGEKPAETSVAFPYAGIAVLRTGWEKNDTWAFFDGGPFGKAHQHEDKLNFVLSADGQNTLNEGCCYAYDTSEMRRYVLSTRAHNTVRVDGQDQNRRRDYSWKDEDIHKESGMKWHFSPACDWASAVYDEGYGEGDVCDRDASQERRVFFMKQLGNLKPFFIVADRMTAAENEHTYEVLWHLDCKKFAADGMNVQADSLHVLVPAVPMDEGGLTVAYGQTFPEVQGWKCNSAIQKDYYPVYAAQYRLRGKDLRWVTVLYPDGGKGCPIAGVEASLDCKDTAITLRLQNGETIALDEAVLQA